MPGTTRLETKGLHDAAVLIALDLKGELDAMKGALHAAAVEQRAEARHAKALLKSSASGKTLGPEDDQLGRLTHDAALAMEAEADVLDAVTKLVWVAVERDAGLLTGQFSSAIQGHLLDEIAPAPSEAEKDEES